MREPPRSVSFISRICGLLIGHPPPVPPSKRLELLSRLEIHRALYGSFVAFRGVLSCLYISMPTRLSHSRFTYAQIEAGSLFRFQKRGDEKVQIRRVNAINEFVRITCPATRSRLSASSYLSFLDQASWSPLCLPFSSYRARILGSWSRECGHKLTARVDR